MASQLIYIINNIHIIKLTSMNIHFSIYMKEFLSPHKKNGTEGKDQHTQLQTTKLPCEGRMPSHRAGILRRTISLSSLVASWYKFAEFSWHLQTFQKHNTCNNHVQSVFEGKTNILKVMIYNIVLVSSQEPSTLQFKCLR